MHKIHKYKKAFTLMEIMIVMLIIGIGLMSLTPKFTSKSVGVDPQLDYLDKLIKTEWERSIELGQPIVITGFKGSANLLNHDKETKTIPDIKEVTDAVINRYQTQGNEYAIRIYPDGMCDYFELTLNDGRIIESIPLLMTTRYKKTEE